MLNIRTFLTGLRILPKTPLASDTMGELEVNSADGTLNYHNGATRAVVVTDTSSSTITGKTIAAGSNHITATANRAAQFNASTGDLEASSVTDTELGYVSGVTSAIQTQLNGKQAGPLTGDVTTSGAAATIANGAVTNVKVASGIDAVKIADGSVSNTEYQYLDGVTSSIQTQFSNKQPLDSTLTALAAYNTSGFITQTAPDTFTGRSMVSASARLVINDGGGVAGNPTFDVSESNLDISAMGGTLAITHGGTGQTTKAPAFDALSPMTTAGDLIYGGTAGTGTRLPIGSATQVLTVSGGLPVWAAAASSGGLTITNKTTTYTAAISDFVTADASGGAFTVTLPTAVGNTNGRIKISKTDSSSNNVTINTTSSQTYDGRSSGDLKLYRQRDYAEFISDGTNWLINDKIETQTLYSAPGAVSISNGAAGSYLTQGATVTLGIGKWRLRAYFYINTGSGTSIGLINSSGLYSADGANSGTAPASLSSGTNVKQVEDDSTMGNYNSSYIILPIGVSSNSRFGGGFIETIVTIAGGTQAVYAVPRQDYTTAGTSTVTAVLRAERIW